VKSLTFNNAELWI